LGQGGSAGPLRGAKGSTFEGGVRVPFIARWPGKVPAGRESDEPAAIMDLLPTLVTLAGGTVPNDRVIDGQDIWPVIAGKDGAKSPHEAIYYLSGRALKGVRMGDWKYMIAPASEILSTVEVELTPEEQKLPRRQRNALIKERTKAAQGRQVDVEMLFNLREDLAEANDLIDQHPEIAARLKSRLKAFESEFRKTLRSAGTAE
jgi:arylsulfatase A-like enzyme